MPPRTQSAHLVLLSTLPEVGDPGPRIRVVGRVVGRDVEHSYVLIEDEELAVSVDLSNVVGMEEGYLPALKDLVMVTGELCLSDDFVVPSVQAPHSSPSIAGTYVLRALLIKQCEELDMEDWRTAVCAATN